ncbi:MAG TPA: outer membrane beta-barrel protein [Parafilimonas sp.]|nr:outer membrane beta-barrel protein [Parafilimonas sp.]
MSNSKHLVDFFKKRIAFLFFFLCMMYYAKAQKEQNRPDHDNLPYYFGLTFGYSNMNLQTSKDVRFLQYDSVLSVEPGASGGFAAGLLATAHLNNRFEFRIAPQLIVGGAKYFTYSLKYPNANETAIEKKTLPSTIFTLPLEIKFNSDRIDNFRVYMLGGLTYDIDLASNSNERNAEDLIKLKKNDYAIEGGVGFNFFLRFVTLSPEIKIHNGLTNIHDRDPNLKFSNVLDKLKSRMIIFSINIEP